MSEEKEKWNDPEDAPDDMKEADRLVTEAVQKISEHVDAVTIFVSKKREDGGQGTWKLVSGAGNFFARYGQVKLWVQREEQSPD